MWQATRKSMVGVFRCMSSASIWTDRLIIDCRFKTSRARQDTASELRQGERDTEKTADVV